MTMKSSLLRLRRSFVAIAVALVSQSASAAGLIELYRESIANDAV